MCSGTPSYTQQNINMIEMLHVEQDIVSLEKRIARLIKKKPEIANVQGLRQFHILLLGNTNIRKERFLDRSFLRQITIGDYFHLYPIISYRKGGGWRLNVRNIFRKNQKYIQTVTFITDSTGNLVAKGDARFVTPIYKGSYFELSDMKLAKMFFDKEIDFVFWLGFPHSTRYMIGIKDNNLYGLQNTQEGLKIYTWDEFMECCFDEWVFKPSR